MRILNARTLVPAALVALGAYGWSTTTQAPPTPGPSAEQKRLEALVGEWEADLTMKSPMGQIEAKGVEKNRMVCGGMWLETVFTGDVMGMPFEGRGMLGWDAEKEAYSGLWVDNMSPAFTVMTGTWSEENNGITWTYPTTDMMGRKGTSTSVDSVADANTRTTRMRFAPKGGEDEETMTIRYRRKGTGKPTEASSGAKKSDG